MTKPENKVKLEPPKIGLDPAVTDCLATNPYRPPDWRWHRAGQLLAPRSRRRRWDDAWVVRARVFRRAMEKAYGNLDHPRLVRQHAEAIGALRLHRGNARKRWEVEARLLAGQDDEAIGARLGIPAGVIGAYEPMFYATRHRLGYSDWVMAVAIGPRAYEELQPGDHELMAKLLAFQGGPFVLDAWLASVGESPRADPGQGETLGLLVSIMTTSVTAANAIGLIKLAALSERIHCAEDEELATNVMKPVAIGHFDVPDGPPTLPIVSARCTVGDLQGQEIAGQEQNESVAAAG